MGVLILHVYYYTINLSHIHKVQNKNFINEAKTENFYSIKFN